MYNQKPLLGTLPNYAHPLTPNVGAWLMNEGSGNKVFDLSGNGNHGDFGAGAAAPTWVPGRKGSGLDFDGNNDYIGIVNSDSIDITTDEITLAILLKPDVSITDNRQLIRKDENYILYAGDATDRITLYFYQNGGTRIKLDSDDNVITPQAYNFIASTISSGTGQIYLDGVPINTNVTSFGAPQVLTNNLYIGGDYVGDRRYVDGTIVMIMIYNWALSASEIWQLDTDPYCWLAQPMGAELMYAAPPIGAILNQFQRANIGADLYDGVLIT